MKNLQQTNLKSLLFTVGILILLNAVGSKFFHRFDLTQDKRYTLSQTSLNILKDVKDPLIIDVFLEGQFPGEFKKTANGNPAITRRI